MQPMLGPFFKFDEACLARKDTHAKEDLLIYGVQKNRDRRCFYIGGVDDLFNNICNARTLQRSFYELVESGRPCHLYFDIEFPLAENCSLAPEKVVENIVSASGTLLKEILHADIDFEAVFQKDASNSKKFSRHVLVSDTVRV